MGAFFQSEEQPWQVASDRGFGGVDGSVSPRLLDAGLVAAAVNIDFADGTARTRAGFMGVSWGRGRACPFPWRFLARWPRVTDGTETEEAGISFATAAPLGTVAGAGIYSDPFGVEAVLLAAGGQVRRLQAGSEPLTITVPGELPERVRLVQAFEKVVMFGGEGFAPLVWDPRQTMDAGLGAFTPIDRLESENPYAEPLPEGHYAVEMGGRLWVAYGRDQLAVSEVYDYTNFDPVWGAFRLNEGSDDQIQAICPYREGTVAVLFDQSVWMIAGATGDLSEMRAAPVTDRFGCVGPDAFSRVGADLWMLSHDGVRVLRMGDDGSARADDGPISEPVSHVLERVNWGAAGVSQMSVHGRRVYLAVPLDGSSAADALLVYDLDRKAWMGLWTGSGVDFARLLVAEHGNARRQMAASVPGVLFLVGEGHADNLLGTDEPIDVLLRTRTYAGEGGGHANHCLVDADLATWGEPAHRLRILGDGPGETSEPTGLLAPSRERWLHWSRASLLRDGSNAAGDHAAAGRMDYSVALPAAVYAVAAYAGSVWGVAYPEALAVLSPVPADPNAAFAGGFDPDEIERLVEEAGGTWNAYGIGAVPEGYTVTGWDWRRPAEDDGQPGVDGVPLEAIYAYKDLSLQRWLVVRLPVGMELTDTWESRSGPVRLDAPWHGEGCRLDLEARMQWRMRSDRAGAGVAVEMASAGGAVALHGVSVAFRPGGRDYRAKG